MLRDFLYYLSLGTQREFIKENGDLADNVNTYKARVFDL